MKRRIQVATDRREGAVVALVVPANPGAGGSGDGRERVFFRCLHVVDRRVDAVNDVLDRAELGFVGGVDGRLKLPKGVDDLVLDGVFEDRAHAVRNERRAQSPASSQGLRGQPEPGGAGCTASGRVVGVQAEVAPGVFDGAGSAVLDADQGKQVGRAARRAVEAGRAGGSREAVNT